MIHLAEKLIREHGLSKEEYAKLLRSWEEPGTAELLAGEAVRLRRCWYGDKVYARGLIEFTNYCKIIVITAESAAATTMRCVTA